MATKKFDLTDLVTPGVSESISGRDFGISYAGQIQLLNVLDKGDDVEFVIDSTYVKAINDSFIKGLFSKVFEKYRNIEDVKKRIKIKADDYFVRLFEKNWYILQALNSV